MRVFELARELNMPSKQLIHQMMSFGIVAESNFKGLTEEEIAFIKAKLIEIPEQTVSSDASIARTGKVIRRKRIPAESDAETMEVTSERRARRVIKTKKAPEAEAPPLEEKPVAPPPLEEIPVEMEKVALEEEKEPAEKSAVEPAEPEKSIEPEVAESQPAVETKAEPEPLEEEADLESKPLAETIEKEKEIAPAPPLVKPADLPPPAEKKKKSVEFIDLDAQRPAAKDPKRDKRSAWEEESITEGWAKKSPKRFHLLVPPEDEGDQWERTRRKRNRRNRQKIKVLEKKKHTFNPRKKSIKIGSSISVGELAGQIGIKATDIIKKLMTMEVMATINQNIPGETAALIASEFSIDVELETARLEDVLELDQDVHELIARAPIVTIMGHVDHGKTSLLDKIRETQVSEGEAGGITQHIGAYRVETPMGDITFLDTPGHEAFTAMRARGANVTDIVVLVVAADDGVQPQTIEAIHHAQAAGVPIIVVINKIDRPQANPSRVQQGLLEHNLVSEDLGGETIFVKASAKTGEGLEHLLEMIHLQAEVLELKAPLGGNSRGVIIESQIIKGRGPVGTVLIQQGTLRVGDFYVVGDTFGKVRALFDDKGHAIQKVTPSTPAEVLGFNSTPTIGEHFIVLDDEKTARQIAENRASKGKDDEAAQQRKLHLENLFSRIASEEHVELKILIKADVQGSVEALQASLSQLGNEQVSIRFLHTGIGNITENDVLLASASDAIIIGFNTMLDVNAKIVNSREKVDVRLYDVIYNAIDDAKKALEGMLKPLLRDEVIGRCEVRQIFNANKSGQILGCYVTEGKLLRDVLVRIFRSEDVVHEGDLLSLKRFKDDVSEVLNNYECGVVVDSHAVQVGDVIEAYVQVEESATL